MQECENGAARDRADPRPRCDLGRRRAAALRRPERLREVPARRRLERLLQVGLGAPRDLPPRAALPPRLRRRRRRGTDAPAPARVHLHNPLLARRGGRHLRQPAPLRAQRSRDLLLRDGLRATPARRGRISRVTGPAAAPQHLRDLARLRRVRDRIDREYAQPLDVEALARAAHMSAGHLSRQFKLAYGESPYSYLMTRRIERAMALLRRGDLTVTEVCFDVGCSSLGTFSTRFTELVGVPPSVYRRRAAGAMSGIPPCVVKQVTRPVRNREAPVPSRA